MLTLRSGLRSSCASDPKQPPVDTAQQLQRKDTNGDLASYNKPALVELAASIGIEKRATMTKSQLVDAIGHATRDAD